MLIDSAFTLFGEGGDAAVSVRSVSRVAELNTRYFYENFTDTDELLGAVYDRVAEELGRTLTNAMAATDHDERARLRAGIRAVLDFSSADPRRGKILFTEARTNPVLAERRSKTQDHLRESILRERPRIDPESDWLATEIGAAMYAGAMAELARQWLAGSLGGDLDAVVGHTLRMLLPQARTREPAQ